jgi:hypothetical protein
LNAFTSVVRIASRLDSPRPGRRPISRPRSARPGVERLDGRRLLSTFFVATKGSDQNPGTITRPFATIPHALDVATQPGDTIEVRKGVYHQKIAMTHSGSAAGGFITLEAYPGEHAILDGRGVPSSDVGFGNDMVQMNDVSYVRVMGFDIRNDIGLSDVKDGSGVRVTGSGSNIQILANHIHAIRGTGGGMGISVYGTSLTVPLSNIVISGNVIDHCTPGRSEALTLDGNVTDFQVTDNVVHHVNNIGIDMIGGEYAVFGLSGPRPDLPVARDGVCSGNTVYRASSGEPVSNPAGGIYVDGGRDIIVSGNRSTRNDLGIEVGAENPGYVASGIVVEDNLLYRNENSGLVFGGYNRTRGRVEDCRFVNNTLYRNDTLRTGNGQLWIQWASSNVVTNNIFDAGRSGALIGADDPGSNIQNLLDSNLYFTPVGPDNARFNWNGQTYGGFVTYREATGEDSHSHFGDPAFVEAGAGDFQLSSSSPAVGAGTITTGQFDPIDFDGTTRGTSPDIGAY